MNIKKQAKLFIKKYKIKKLTYQLLIQIIENQGFKIIEFGKWQSKGTTLLIKNLKLDNKCSLQNSFLYVDKDLKLLFIKEELSEDEKLSLLSHEEAHVFLGHNINNEIVDTSQEDEANEFSLYIRKYDRNKISVYYSIALILILALGFLTTPLVKSMANKNKPTTTNNSTSINTTANTTIHSTSTTVLTTAKELNPNEQVFITETGKKFHREGCQYIKDKTNLKIYIIEEAKELGYSACEKCFD